MSNPLKSLFRRLTSIDADKLAKGAFLASAAIALWGYGVAAAELRLFPYPQIKNIASQARRGVASLTGATKQKPHWWYQPRPARAVSQTRTLLPGAVNPGYVLVSGFDAGNKAFIKIIDNDGAEIHRWKVDRRKLWPNPSHLAKNSGALRKPAEIHGLTFLENGDVVFNFEEIGLLRVNYCGEVIWRLPYKTHHSVELDRRTGNFFVGGLITHKEADERYPNYKPPFDEFTVLEVSPAGKIINETPIFDILMRNNLDGLMYMSSTDNWATVVSGDTLHANDVEPFQADMPAGVFSYGDILLSMRNINTVLVYNRFDKTVKYVSTGAVIRQHDADFLDGDTISIFDNNNLAANDNDAMQGDNHSRIVMLDARSNEISVAFEGTDDFPFFSNIMGRQERLPNGSLMITSAREGHAFEVTPDRRVAWEYYNLVGDDQIGLINAARRLPRNFNKAYFDKLDGQCAAKR
ncbi:MAG: arylsulfotransferase family protein [Parvularculaceae bacterium]